MPLIELIYQSVTDGEMSKQTMQDIINEARQKNPNRNITGCLYYKNRTFLQLLEGEKSEVESLFAKIQKDPRHFNPKIVWQGEIGERSFAKFWMMYFNNENNDLLFDQPEEFNQTTATALFELIRQRL